MKKDTRGTTVVIGAGPYGLSVAAHLKEAGVPTLVFGKPMEFWQSFPQGMNLRSAWSASSLSDPAGRYSLDRFREAVRTPQQLPIPLPFFIAYGLWFQREAVPDLHRTYVNWLTMDKDGFRLELAGGEQIRADRVVVAAGIASFANVPEFARDLPASLAAHTSRHSDFDAFRGARVAVVGAGQSAIESSALLNEAGAHVELIARGTVRWLKLHDYRGPGRKLLYAPSDVGPPGLNWLLHFPLVFRQLPVELRRKITRRAVRPAGARWLLNRVVGHVTLTTNAEVAKATPDGSGLRLDLSDGTSRQVDYLLLATGYRPNLQKLTFLAPEVRERIRVREGFPQLNRWLESSIPGLHFAGGLADHSYGPICRFVSGAAVASRQIAARASRAV